ncbi:MAG: peptidase A2, partial [Gammaproteobacteria bacterium]|nr:peptidase A2 [Gammaproteobacteria bacterium]
MSDGNSYEKGISRASQSVVNVSSKLKIESKLFNKKNSQDTVGSGIIISNDGYIITNLHVIKGNRSIDVEL